MINVLVGGPGMGKSTYVKSHPEWIDIDDVITIPMIEVSKTCGLPRPYKHPRWSDFVSHVVQWLVQMGVNNLAIHNNYKWIETIRSTAAIYGFKVRFFRFDIDFDEWRARAIKRLSTDPEWGGREWVTESEHHKYSKRMRELDATPIQ